MNRFSISFVRALLGLSVVFSISSCSAAQSTRPTPNGCSQSAKGVLACYASFGAISNAPESYDGLDLTISGYVVIDNGALSVYADETSYAHRIIENGLIIVRGPLDLQKSIFDRYGYKYARISGVFRASKVPGDVVRYELGSIGGDIKVWPLPDRTGGSEREDWGDVRIDVKDLSSAAPAASPGSGARK